MTGILLLNMLIAMMAKTFGQVWQTSTMNYIFLLAQKTFTFVDSPRFAPPCYLLSMPYFLYRSTERGYRPMYIARVRVISLGACQDSERQLTVDTIAIRIAAAWIGYIHCAGSAFTPVQGIPVTIYSVIASTANQTLTENALHICIACILRTIEAATSTLIYVIVEIECFVNRTVTVIVQSITDFIPL